MALDILVNYEFFQLIVFFILLIFAYIIAKAMHLQDSTSILVLHVFLLCIFVFMQMIDYIFLIIAIIEISLLLRSLKNNTEGISHE